MLLFCQNKKLAPIKGRVDIALPPLLVETKKIYSTHFISITVKTGAPLRSGKMNFSLTVQVSTREVNSFTSIQKCFQSMTFLPDWTNGKLLFSVNVSFLCNFYLIIIKMNCYRKLPMQMIKKNSCCYRHV